MELKNKSAIALDNISTSELEIKILNDELDNLNMIIEKKNL